MVEEGPIDVLWEGGFCCMSGRVGSIPRSKDGMGDSSGSDCGVGGRMSDPGQRCGVGGGMVGLGDGCGVDEWIVGLRDGCGVDGEGSGVGTTQGVATSGRKGHPARAELVLGPSVVLGPAGVVASSFEPSGMGGCTQSRRCITVSTSLMSLWSSMPTG